MADYKEVAHEYYQANPETVSKEFRTKAILEQVYEEGFKDGINHAVGHNIDNMWHKKTEDGWTDWEYPIPPSDELIVTVYEDNCDNPYYYTTYAWYLADFWIKDNDILNGVVAWKRFPKSCEEK